MDSQVDAGNISVNIEKTYVAMKNKVKTFVNRTGDPEKIAKRIRKKIAQYIDSTLVLGSEREKEIILDGVVNRLAIDNESYNKSIQDLLQKRKPVEKVKVPQETEVVIPGIDKT